MSGANAWGNERVWSENHFSLISSKNHGGGGEATRIITSKKSHFWKKHLLMLMFTRSPKDFKYLFSCQRQPKLNLF